MYYERKCLHRRLEGEAQGLKEMMLFPEKHSCSSGFYVTTWRHLCDKAKYTRPFSVIKPHHRQLVREKPAPNNRWVSTGCQHSTHTHPHAPFYFLADAFWVRKHHQQAVTGPGLYYKVSRIPKPRSSPCKLMIPKEHKRPAQNLIFLWASTECQTYWRLDNRYSSHSTAETSLDRPPEHTPFAVTEWNLTELMQLHKSNLFRDFVNKCQISLLP